ncbi:hypothetical protein QNI16_03250 [Cytophagaceae bacterium YF14B1]|uniref:Uncharacterized protein n=1 Tax=Xanthocytophaga flava TaxID=3048013 RepID=A0AAE3QM67_9BACT|nr:hypothetical protein [Xanthocytophaga flavus]MDJ1479486.1 hypothetical protein [Xanthocytophaga flavus]
MPRYHTNTTAIRKYKSEYYGLMVYEARLNHELFRMEQRIKAIKEDEKQSLADQILLTKLLAHATQQKAQLEAQPASKERNKQLKKAEKEFTEVNAKHKRNEYHLAVLEKKKDKDNAAKYVLKELKRDEVRIRIKTAYDIWKKLEQEEQYEFMDFELFKALHFVKQSKQAATQTTTNTQSELASEKPLSVAGVKPFIQEKSTRVIVNAYSNRFQNYLTVTNPEDQNSIHCTTQKQFTYSIQEEIKTKGSIRSIYGFQ